MEFKVQVALVLHPFAFMSYASLDNLLIYAHLFLV
jgi:hypothetical protein